MEPEARKDSPRSERRPWTKPALIESFAPGQLCAMSKDPRSKLSGHRQDDFWDVSATSCAGVKG